MNFDISIPAEHRYLGPQESVGFADNPTEPTIISLLRMETVLFPLQSFPLTLYGRLANVMVNLAKNEREFGVIGDENIKEDTIGTIAKIASMASNANGTVTIVAKGRQRFRILSVFEGNALPQAHIEYIPELSQLPFPHPSLFYFRKSLPPQLLYSKYKASDATDQAATLEQRNRIIRCCRPKGYWGTWAFRPYDTTMLIQRAKILFSQMFASAIPCSSDDVVGFSWWIASNAALSDRDRREILQAESAVAVLRKSINLLERRGSLQCTGCGTQISKVQHLFLMSCDGVVTNYVNPAGVNHEVLTLRTAAHIHLQGRPQTEHSWFPGYAWTIANCRVCYRHLGWLFTATTTKLNPVRFWGLRRTALAFSELYDENEEHDTADGNNEDIDDSDTYEDEDDNDDNNDNDGFGGSFDDDDDDDDDDAYGGDDDDDDVHEESHSNVDDNVERTGAVDDNNITEGP